VAADDDDGGGYADDDGSAEREALGRELPADVKEAMPGPCLRNGTAAVLDAMTGGAAGAIVTRCEAVGSSVALRTRSAWSSDTGRARDCGINVALFGMYASPRCMRP
jgi:hypothetical protein